MPDAQNRPVSQPLPPPAAALPLMGVTVLLVEDSRVACDAIRLMCQRSGARLRRAGTLREAWVHLHSYGPDVAIVDLGLPDGPGAGLIRDLATRPGGPAVLGLSGDPAARALALSAGAVGFLDKPLPSLSAFQQAVLQHLPGRPVPLESGPHALPGLSDPIALQDDLAHADDLLSRPADAATRGYLTGFVAGLARCAGDADLAAAALAARDGRAALSDLQLLVRQRLSAGAPI